MAAAGISAVALVAISAFRGSARRSGERASSAADEIRSLIGRFRY